MAFISKNNSLFLNFTLAAASLVVPYALSQTAPLQRTPPEAFDCKAEISPTLTERDVDHGRSYQSPDRQALVACEGGHFGFNAAAGVITDTTSSQSISSYLTTVATNGYINSTDPTTPVNLPPNPSAVFEDKRPFPQEITASLFLPKDPKLGDARPAGITAGELYYPTTAGSFGTIAAAMPEGHSTIFAATESFSSTVIFGLVGTNVWLEGGSKNAHIRAEATVGSEIGRNPRGATFEGDLTVGLGPCSVGIQGTQRARDHDDPTERRTGIHADCAEKIPSKMGGISLIQIAEFNHFSNRIGFPTGGQESKSLAFIAERKLRAVDIYVAIAGGGNNTPFGGIPGGDFSGYGRHFKSAEAGVEVSLGKGVSLIGGYGRMDALSKKPEADFTLGDLYAGKAPGEGHYRKQDGALFSLRFSKSSFRLNK